ncbi:MAG TPA: vitamin B12 dependent-methionine synthase activation domain-containing protein [Bacteroidales bacterium]|nr:vitamin B12 dependent-methionine synthase activation domain-containing protein [Bacteroidales bacterium]HOM41097.1 vitamin B12 dependent-methionine synthase activation domain-containing protein [Bacteroidales bacterium]HRR17165.1 vitamin B12 dependent-methionine synthase activation domain-containing protein [Bacteroidales bacterium]HRU57684.1 vitamin B12 dependent-methionine synthase activation domain-containing protein [Bacteroidales bacterium]
MRRYTYRFDLKMIRIDPAIIGRLLDSDRGSDREIVSALAEEVLAEAEKFCDLRAEFVVYPNLDFDRDSGAMIINGVEFFPGKIISAQLRKSESVAVFACTAGSWIGEKARQLLNDKDYLKGYVYDIAGSEIVEAVADLMQEKLSEAMEAEGLHITNRYSPGYCGWNVSEQHKLFSLMPDNYCGITLNESALMSPIKSVSGVIGIGHDVRHNPYTCNICDAKDCIYRRIKQQQ